MSPAERGGVDEACGQARPCKSRNGYKRHPSSASGSRRSRQTEHPRTTERPRLAAALASRPAAGEGSAGNRENRCRVEEPGRQTSWATSPAGGRSHDRVPTRPLRLRNLPALLPGALSRCPNGFLHGVARDTGQLHAGQPSLRGRGRKFADRVQGLLLNLSC